MVNNLVFIWPKPLFFMVFGALGTVRMLVPTVGFPVCPFFPSRCTRKARKARKRRQKVSPEMLVQYVPPMPTRSR